VEPITVPDQALALQVLGNVCYALGFTPGDVVNGAAQFYMAANREAGLTPRDCAALFVYAFAGAGLPMEGPG
jgi:hypothetical protein